MKFARIFSLLSVVLSISAAAQTFPPAVATALQNKLDSSLASYGLKGVSVAVIMPDGTSWQGESGIARSNIPVSSSKDWHYGSHIMPMLAAVSMQLEEEGAWDLSDPISSYFDLSTVPYVDSADGITLENLLQHTTAITNSYYNGSVFKDSVYSDPCRIWTKADCLNPTYWLPAGTNPSAQHVFGGWNNYYLLGCIIEEVENDSLHHILNNRIFQPLGLSSAYVGYKGIDMNTMNGAWFSNVDRGALCWDAYLSSRGGASGLICSPMDAAKFIRAFYKDSLVSSSLMNQAKNPASGSSQTVPFPTCLGTITTGYGYGTITFDAVDANGDTARSFGHSASGLNRALSAHNVDSNFTVSLIQNDIHGSLETPTTGLFLELMCYVQQHLQHPAIGTSEFEPQSVTVYPNPTQDRLTLEGLPEGIEQVWLIAMDGKRLSAPWKQGQSKLIVNTSELGPGSYVLHLVKPGLDLHQSVVISR